MKLHVWTIFNYYFKITKKKLTDTKKESILFVSPAIQV